MSATADEYVQVPYTPFQHPQEAHEELYYLPDDTLDPLKIFYYFCDDGLLATICFCPADLLVLLRMPYVPSVLLALASTILVDLGRPPSYSFYTSIALPISTLSPPATPDCICITRLYLKS